MLMGALAQGRTLDAGITGTEIRFQFKFRDDLWSKKLFPGDEVKGSLTESVLIGDRLVPARSVVVGHVALPPGTKQRNHHSARHSLYIQFDRIVTPDGTTYDIKGAAIRQLSLVTAEHTLRELTVNDDGEIIKVQDHGMYQVPDWDTYIPKSWVDVKSKLDIHVCSGDKLTVSAQVLNVTSSSLSVAGKLLPGGGHK